MSATDPIAQLLQDQMDMWMRQQSYGLGHPVFVPPQVTGSLSTIAAALKGANGRQSPPVPTRESVVALRGFRAWRLDADEDGPLLVSLTRDTKWSGPVQHADKRPTQDNACGIYTYHSAYQTCAHRNEARVTAYGELELSGRVLVHQLGCRAERATVRRLIVVPNPGYRARLDELADRYQCEVAEDAFPWRLL